MQRINKSFPGVRALIDVDFEISTGEVVALIGENGAGKSTLMNILGGVHQPDSGTIEVEGNTTAIKSVSNADQLGIGFVHQELNILDNLDVGANVFLGREPRRLGIVNSKQIIEKTKPFIEMLGLDISPETPVSELSIGQQQMVEIAKALSKNAKIIIMDEPTSSLTLSETEKLLNVISDLRDKGISIIYISHRLGEVSQCADRVIALRDGENAGELSKDQIDHDSMVNLMVGRALERNTHSKPIINTESEGLEISNLRTTSYPNCKVSFRVASGEILGMAGLVGAGRSELAQAIFGVDQTLEGEVKINGKIVSRGSSKESIRCGIYLAPEDRKRTGLVTEFDITKNISLASLSKYASKFGLINNNKEQDVANHQIESLNIKTPSASTPVVNLSGGNQQKVVLGKWLSMAPKAIIFDEPTRGIDVGAKAEIYKLMRDLANQGVAVWMISSDMEEVIGISDRIAVMHEGKITGELSREEFSEETIMHLAVGGKR
ncbi:D-xylose ABC transporter ATP-binding protein [Candidatus Poribacteria bacterium]|nr:D-xylose ABC transporter ATP-binding protein [Candidatus Poribacteria bacterium]